MNGMSHATTALVISRCWPRVPIIPALIAVQISELLWIGFNLLGIESIVAKAPVASLADIHLVHMPFSHSVLASLVLAVLAWFIVGKVLNKPHWRLPIVIGVLSHIVLDIAIHVQDIEIIPFIGMQEIGTGIYALPMLALVVELLYCLFCWFIFQGNKMTLFWLMLGNALVLPIYIYLPVPEVNALISSFADHPKYFVLAIALHTLLGMLIVWWRYNSERPRRAIAT